MIAILIAAIASLALLALAYAGTKHPIKTVGRTVSISCALLATCALIAGMSLYPAASVWQAEKAADAQVELLQAEATRAKAMISQLGSAEAYIQYLKATKED